MRQEHNRHSFVSTVECYDFKFTNYWSSTFLDYSSDALYVKFNDLIRLIAGPMVF
jgi:hypothetical protein